MLFRSERGAFQQRDLEMQKAFEERRVKYEVEAEAIEDTFLAERDELLVKNRLGVDELYERRKADEIKYLAQRRAREESHRREVEELLVKDGEEYNTLKRRNDELCRMFGWASPAVGGRGQSRPSSWT